MLFYIVDDEETIHESLKRVLAKKYPNVHFGDFYELEDLVDELRQNRRNPGAVPVDLILLDNMFDKNAFSSGGITGIDTLPRIRKQAPDVPIILFTAIDNYDEVQRIKQFPEVRYQHKPLDETQLYMVIDDFLREHRQIQEYDGQIQEYDGRMQEYEQMIREYKQMMQKTEERIENLRKTLETVEDEDERVGKIYELLEVEQEKIIRNHKKGYSVYFNAIKLKFRQFDERTVKFLATGEFLYHSVEEANMDYSPIAIDYVKSIEHLTTKILQKRKLIEPKRTVMLGEAAIYINQSMQYWTEDFCSQLKRVHKYRNKTAHSKGISREIVEKLRRILFDRSQVENGEGLLQYMNAELGKNTECEREVN